MNQTELKKCLYYEPKTGVFTWRKKVSDKTVIGAEAGYIRGGYRIIGLLGNKYRAHRLAFLYMLGYMPQQVDHGDHVRDNNAWSNLSSADYETNGKNHPKTQRNSSGVVGVSQRKDGNWIARIYAEKKHVYLGSFLKKKDAVSARQTANIKYGYHQNHGN